MYNISAEELELFRRCYRQTARIKVFGVTGLTDISDADILMNGLTVDRYCFSSGTLEIGTAVASELSLTLDNHTGKFNNYDFDGATLSVSIGIKKWDAKAWEKAVIHYIPLGIFTVDEKSKNASTIVLNALDNMVRFDKVYETDLSFPATLADILQDACTKCGVPQYTTDFTNASYVVAEKPSSDNLTYRQVVQWVAELAASNAWVDWNGALRLNWFEKTGLKISGADRYSSDEEEYSVTITGVKVTVSDDDTASVGEAGCVLNIEGNGLAQSGATGLAESIYTVVGGFTYLPYSCTTRPAPFLFPLDLITYVDNEHKAHSTIVSAMTYVINGVTTVSGEGSGETQAKYASTGGATKQEKLIIEKVKRDIESDSTEKYSTLLHLNQIISGAFGLYQTEIEDNGVKTFYFHDKPGLSDSTIIYVFNAGGFAWTDDWNAGQPVWKYGFTQDGNAVYHILSTYKIQTEYLDAGSVTAEKLSQAYKSAVDKAISDGDSAVTQAFTVADGELNSRITAEKTRAEGVEETLSSSITQNAENISLLVSNGEVRGGVIIQAINDETAVKIAASKVDLTGYVTVSGLSGGTTTIDGSCIKTGKISAERIDADNLTVNAANVSGILSADQISVSEIVGKINETDSELSISAEKINVSGKSLSVTLDDYAPKEDGTSSTFSYSLKSTGLMCYSGGTEVLRVDASGMEVKGIVKADTGNIGKILLEEVSGNYSTAIQSATQTKTVTVTIPAGTPGFAEDVGIWYWFAASKTFSLAELGVTDTNAVLGDFTVNEVDENFTKVFLSGCDSTSITVTAMIKQKASSLTSNRSATTTVSFSYYVTSNLPTEIVRFHSPDNTFDISSAQSTSVLTVNNTRIKSASMTDVAAVNGTIGGLTLNGEKIGANGVSLEFGTNASSNFVATLAVKGNSIFVYVDGVMAFDKVFAVSYLDNGAIFEKTANVTVKKGSSFGKIEIPIFDEITSAVFTANRSVSYYFSATTVDDTWEACLRLNNVQFLSDGVYDTTDNVRYGGSIGNSNYRWYALYAKTIYGKTIYQNGAAVSTSDRAKKNSIVYIDEIDNTQFSDFLDALRPVEFRYNDGESGRTHWGLIAQDVADALKATDLIDKSAIYCEWKEQNIATCGLRYEELLPLLTLEIQKLRRRVKTLEERNPS